ncbi:hypothetical protein [Sphingomonas sp.]|uniref:hypothetical protein n=1 Tax=Sphingomonas sp. TaxID=28214 RepID=UPI003D6D4250
MIEISQNEKDLLDEFDCALRSGKFEGKPLFKNMAALSVIRICGIPLNHEQSSMLPLIERYIVSNGETCASLSNERSQIAAALAGVQSGAQESALSRLLLMASSVPEDADIDDVEYIVEWARLVGLDATSLRKIAIQLLD